jgi:hypothetical protein
VLPPPDHEATFEELPAAAERTQENAGALVGTEGPAEILGLTTQNVGRLPANGRLLWLPTGRTGGGPTRVYRRASANVPSSTTAAIMVVFIPSPYAFVEAYGVQTYGPKCDEARGRSAAR